MDVSQAIVRAEKIKEEKRNRSKQKNRDKADKFNVNKLMILQKEYRRKIEMDEKLGNKLQKAQQQKKYLQDEKLINRFTDGIEFFKRHWMFREETRKKNVKLCEMHEEEKRQNMEKRIKRIEQIREKDEIKKIKLRREFARKERSKVIIEKVRKQAQKLSESYLKLVDQKDFKEIFRRFSMLTEPFIAECLKKVNSVLQDLKIVVSGATLVEKLLSIMTQLVVMRPEIGQSRCVLIRQRVAGFIVHTITQIKNDRLKHIKNNWIKKQRNAFHEGDTSDEKDSTSKHVSMDDSAHIIGESAFSFDEFIGDLKSVSVWKIEKTVRKSLTSNKNNRILIIDTIFTHTSTT
ncbi:uncharacterized protein LOC129567896 [Sitodiplosis mosellana]|uniref:uncharacterized protein LOC129567896 n=1 Tax=Sitodiplosis mosellana TaxID=263140 RepID=UPI0024438E9C|nr:uncharacterized protein LOC129567896 [Sitodiplosis mosellana]